MTNYNPIKILLVDDDAVTNFIVSRKLSKLGIENIDAVENGAEALEYLENNEPNVIFLDINMPIMDGHEFMLEYKKRELSEEVKVFILSSSDRTCDKNKFLNFANVLDYIEKPLELENIKKAFKMIELVF
ncbi:hypothetical protein LCGC14_0117630 [marine sediment metagenome]|uniref:Response regulatory domain-containing protein n=1 Tax=marine sediment metagenome TaxID=412755 RepID=A0A0F9V7C7_9ZZZZ|nr:response regulator [Maribacter sp.]HDZ07270.1 response regulator [Maribacter sp.]